MKNNKISIVHDPLCDPSTLKCRNRLIRLHNALGNWRNVQQKLGVKNVATVYNFAMHGIEPRNTEERVKLGIERVKKPRSPFAGMPRWFERTPEALTYFKYIQNQVRVLSNETRDGQYQHRKSRDSRKVTHR